MVKVKICGIKSLEIAKDTVALGADMLGLVFANSKRKIDIKTAWQIRTALDKTILVGVFKNQPLSEILQTSLECNIDIVQLHGDETPNIIERIKKPIFRSVAVDKTGQMQFPFDSWQKVDAFLFDTALADGSSGGAGETFSWDGLPKIDFANKIIIAGGLNPENVGKAVKLFNPYAVDVSGGVEINGKKSLVLIEKFINSAKYGGEKC